MDTAAEFIRMHERSMKSVDFFAMCASAGVLGVGLAAAVSQNWEIAGCAAASLLILFIVRNGVRGAIKKTDDAVIAALQRTKSDLDD